LKEINLKKETRSLEFAAFCGCRNIEKIHISGIPSIDHHVFRECRNLKTINLQEGTKIIREFAFDDCINLERVTFPTTLTRIASNAFKRCAKLKEVRLSKGVKINENSFPGHTKIIIN